MLPRDFHLYNVNIADDQLQFCLNFGILENRVNYEGAFLNIPKWELNISCTSTTAESRAKIWYQ